MDRNASEILAHSTFKHLSKVSSPYREMTRKITLFYIFPQESLEEVLRRDSFFAPEVQIFVAVSEWCKHNSNVDIESVVSYVRLPLMNFDHLFEVVRRSGILDPNRLLDAIEEKTTSKCLPYRGALCKYFPMSVWVGSLLNYV